MSNRRRFIAGVLCGLVSLAVAQLIVNRSAFPDRLVAPLLLTDTPGNADVIVALGAGVVGPCVPNNNGLRRALLAARLWRAGRAPVVLFTGGFGEQASCPIAVAMARFAREIGVPESSIHVETASQSTHENAERSAALLRGLGAQRLILVTDRLHMRRASESFARLGFDIERVSVPIYEGHDNNVDMLAAGARELTALAYYRMRGWIGPGLVLHAEQARRAGEAPANMIQRDIRNATGPLVVLGASYAGGWDPQNIAGRSIVNRGVSGQQSFEMLARFEHDVVAANPRAVIIWGFINDIFRAPAQGIDATLGRIRDSYTKMIALSRRNGIEPILATEVTIRPSDTWSETFSSWLGALMGKEGYQDRINRDVIATNRWLMELGKQEGLLVLDLHGALAEEGGRRRREFVHEDGSHITAAGYAALTAYAKPILEQHLKQQ